MTTTAILPALVTLQAKPQWVCWCYEPDANGRLTKVPYQARNGYKASTTEESHWSTYTEACNAKENSVNRDGKPYDGIGFVFNADITGADLDHCIDENGHIDPWAQEIIDNVNSYCELSPSETGIHILAAALLPEEIGKDGVLKRAGKKVLLKGERDPKAAIEMYCQGRFFTITGKHLPGSPVAIERRQKGVAHLFQQMTARAKDAPGRKKKTAPTPPLSMTDAELIEKAMHAKDGADFTALWHGDTSRYGGDDSGADLALCNKLAFWTGKDAHRMERLFRQSGLYREEKWERNARSGETYGEGTIARAIASCHEIYTGKKDQLQGEDVQTNEAPGSASTIDIDQIITDKNLDALLTAIPTLAQFDRTESLRYEIKIKQAFGDLINMKSFQAAITEKRKEAISELARARKANVHAEYDRNEAGMFYHGKDGEAQLSNFTAEIMADVITDDGAERVRFYELDAALLGRSSSFELPAKDFAKCDWVDEHLGARARITAGQSIKAHLVNAIKFCSEPQEMFKFAHTGWRKVDGSMVYLHAGGFLSQVSQVDEEKNIDLTNLSQFDKPAIKATLDSDKYENSQVSQASQVKTRERGNLSCVSLTGSLSNYHFPDERTDIQQAVRASLKILDLTKDTITVPLYCAIWRAVLSDVDFGIHLAGQSGWGKTELGALIQQHYGRGWSSRHLPGSWESTENSLEMLLFQAKDTVVVVDDFKPKGSKNDQDRLHAKADRVFRQIGNGAARGRLTSTLEQRAERRPRCLLISTGEDVPRGQSLKARGVVLTMTEKITATGSLQAMNLKAAQNDGKQGLYAQAMAAYLEWLAPHIEGIQAQWSDRIAAERDRLSINGHGRAGTNTANLLLAMKLFLKFACECNAITLQEAQQYLERCETALRQIANDAAQENAQERPSEQWRRLLIAALTNKNAHLVTPAGDNPGAEYGWIKSVRTMKRDDGETIEEETYRGGGPQIGWIDGEDIYLLPTAAYAAAKAMGSATGDEITTLEQTLRKFLVQDKVLASTGLDSPRKTIAVRRTLEKTQRDVLHIKQSYIYPPCNSPDYDDLLDYEPSKPALEAGPEVSQVNGKNASQSSDPVDYDLTKSPSSHKETMKALYAQVNAYVDDLQKTKKWQGSLYWYGAATGFESGLISLEEYGKRVFACRDSGDEQRMAAAICAMQRTLTGAGREQSNSGGATPNRRVFLI